MYSGLFVSTQVNGVSKPVGLAYEMLLCLLFVSLISVRGGALVSWLGSMSGLQSRGIAVLDHRWKEGPEDRCTVRFIAMKRDSHHAT